MLRYVAHGVMAIVTNGPIFKHGRNTGRLGAEETGTYVKCGYFLQEFSAGAQEYDVLFAEHLSQDADVRCDLLAKEASVTPGLLKFSRSLRKLFSL